MFKNITRTVWVISLVSLFNDFSSEMLYPVIPLYLESIGYGSVLIGILEGIAEFLSGIAKIYTGSLSDAYKRRLPFVQIGYFLSVLSRPLMGLFPFAAPIIGARILDRGGKGIRSGARDALLADESNESNRAEVFGFHRSMDTLGAVIGPLAALLFLFFFPENYKAIFLLTIIPGALALLCTFFIKEKKKERTEKVDFSLKKHFSYYDKASVPFKKLMFIFLLFALVNSSDMFLLLKAKEIGMHEQHILLAYVFFNLVFALSAFPLGKLADRLGRYNILIVGLVFYAICYALIGSATSNLFIYLGLILYGLYYACTDGVLKSKLLEFSKKEDKSSAMGLYLGLNSISLLIANFVAGWVWWKLDSTYLFYGTIATTLIIISILILQRKQFVRQKTEA